MPAPASAFSQPSQAVVIFQGSPSQAVNAPYFAKATLVIVVMLLVFHTAVMYWPVPFATVMASMVWAAPLVVCLILVSGMLSRYLRVASTVYTIDLARITARHGIATKVIGSLELFRIQDVVFAQNWWERIFNIGTLVINTSDYFHPRMVLVGMRNAETLRDALNRAAVDLRQNGGYREVTVGRA